MNDKNSTEIHPYPPYNWDAESGDWWFETDFMAAGRLDIRRVKKMSILCDVESGAYISAYILRDGEKFNPETAVPSGKTNGEGRVMLRVMIRQTSAYMHRIRIVGHGKVKIYAAEIQISWGGDLYKEG